VNPDRADHFLRCPVCGGGIIDIGDLAQVIEHASSQA
jgi:Zn-finger nucleic acid-binding protein